MTSEWYKDSLQSNQVPSGTVSLCNISKGYVVSVQEMKPRERARDAAKGIYIHNFRYASFRALTGIKNPPPLRNKQKGFVSR